MVATVDLDLLSTENRVPRIRKTVDQIQTLYGSRLNGKIAAIGHSRGGSAVILYANEYGNSEDIKAIISLAPDTSLTPNLDLNSSRAEFFLGLYGAQDEDTLAVVTQNNLSKSAMAIYDRAGTEYTSSGSFSKAFLYLHGGSHAWFGNAIPWSPIKATEPYLGKLQQVLTTKAYVNAALRWKLWDESYYENYFKEQWVPS